MPQIIVLADVKDAGSAVVFRERVNPVDFASEHSARQLLQRLDWAVGDAAVYERRAGQRDWQESEEPGYAWDATLRDPSASVLTTAS
jgi:hypothetical protein